MADYALSLVECPYHKVKNIEIGPLSGPGPGVRLTTLRCCKRAIKLTMSWRVAPEDVAELVRSVLQS